MLQEEDYERMRVYSNQCEEHGWKAIEEATPVDFTFATAFAYANLAETYDYLAKLETEVRKRQETLNSSTRRTMDRYSTSVFASLVKQDAVFACDP